MGKTYDSFTASEKWNIVEYAFQHGKRAAGWHFNVNEANVPNWKKQYDKLKTVLRNKCANCGKSAKFPELETGLYHWICNKRDEGFGVSTTGIRIYASQLFKSNYSASADSVLKHCWTGVTSLWTISNWVLDIGQLLFKDFRKIMRKVNKLSKLHN